MIIRGWAESKAKKIPHNDVASNVSDVPIALSVFSPKQKEAIYTITILFNSSFFLPFIIAFAKLVKESQH